MKILIYNIRITDMKELKKGSKGDEVKALQGLLKLYVDGIFGSQTEEAVKLFQVKKGLKTDGIVGPKTWALLQADQSLKISKRSINEIIVHCTASKEGVPMTVDQIRKIHIKERGWSDIGYHYVVSLDGSVHEGRDVNVAGAHCKYHNMHSIGVVYVGGLDKNGKAKDTRTPEQKAALKKLIQQLKKIYPGVQVHGHREFANKACPCFDARVEYNYL